MQGGKGGTVTAQSEEPILPSRSEGCEKIDFSEEKLEGSCNCTARGARAAQSGGRAVRREAEGRLYCMAGRALTAQRVRRAPRKQRRSKGRGVQRNI